MKLIATYEFEIEAGEIPAAVVIDALTKAEKEGDGWNLWEAGTQPELTEITEATD